MKRRDLIKRLKGAGWYFEREGSNHTIYTNGKKSEAIGRHTEIDEKLARKILRRNGLK